MNMQSEKTPKEKTNMELLELVENLGDEILKLKKKGIEQENLIEELLKG